MKTELNPEDRDRIEQAVEEYTKDWPRNKLPANKVAFRNGAEYENKYQREQQLPYEKIHYDQAETIVFLDQKVKQLEAERSELRTIEDVVKAFDAGKLAGERELRNKVIEECIAMICSTAPEYGPIEIGVKKVHELLNSLKTK